MSGKRDRERRREERLREEGEADRQERRKRLLQLGSAAAFLALAVVVVLIVISQNESDGGDVNLEGTNAVSSELQGIPQSGLVLGEPSAEVTLVEFGDLQCPVCKSFSEEVLPPVIETKVRTGVAKLEFRNFTIISEESVPAGAAAIAAGEQGRGWNFVELFYRNQGLERSGYVTDSFLTEIARGAGVKDIAKWNKDRKSGRVTSEVRTTSGEAERLGFNGTPSFAIEGPSTSGLEPLGPVSTTGEIEEAIDAER